MGLQVQDSALVARTQVQAPSSRAKNMNTPGPIALRAVTDAEANVGVSEDPPGSNFGRYVSIYLASCGIHEAAPWCAAFVSYRLIQAAIEEHTTWMHHIGAYVPDWVNWAKANNLWIEIGSGNQVERGDLICYFDPLRGECHHIGFMRGFNDPTLLTVEGNTGNMVAEHRRTWGQLPVGSGFIRLPW